MIVLGIILLIAAALFGVHVFFFIGVVVLIIGAGLALAGATGRRIGGRRHYY